MRSYLILTPPGGPEPDHRSTVVLKDGFTWEGFLLSWIWLLWHRLWLAGLVVLVLQIASGVMLQMPSLMPAGAALGLALSLLVGLEGRNYLSGSLVRRGWVLEAVLFAQDRETAEQMYFSGLPKPSPAPMPSASDWANGIQPTRTGPSLSLFDHGGR